MKTPDCRNAGFRIVVAISLCVLSALSSTPARAAFVFHDIVGPPGSLDFGTSVTALPNGNFVVTDPRFNTNRGAVFLYNPYGVLLSQLTADIPLSGVGSGGITVLANGNYVVSSPDWTNSYSLHALGAITWCSQVSGCSGVVSANNSLVGSNSNDYVGYDFYGSVVALPNSNYVIPSPSWNYGTVVDAGAITWGDGTSGTVGEVSVSNSLVGSTANDQIGSAFDGGISVLTNGNYVVRSPGWDNSGIVDAGAVTWGNGTGGTVGVVSVSNSLVGSSANDRLGDTLNGEVTELANGNYVVINLDWDLDATHPDVGAVTWGSGTTGITGPLSVSNSLVGVSQSAPLGDRFIDTLGVTTLTNGNYVVSSPYLSLDGSAAHRGAVTWGNGATGVAGPVSASNSLVGSFSGDYVGYEVIALTNGNYVVVSPDADIDSTHYNTGAVTWGSGISGITGAVSAANSLFGPPNVGVGGEVIALANGNYVVSSSAWYDETGGPSNVGAVTWGNGAIGITGKVSTANSLVGVSFYDSVSDGGLVALTNGNYVVISISKGDAVGYVTWGDGASGTIGVVSTANSLVGSTPNDKVGGGLWGSGVIALTNGNYVVSSPSWDNGSIQDAGAVTWGDGANGTVGVVSPDNSLVGGAANDQVGSYYWDGGVSALTNGNYVVSIPQWDNGSVVDTGAVAWGYGMGGIAGLVSAANSLVGSSPGDMVGDGSFYGAPGVTVLPNGNYIVSSPDWSDGSYAGAITWGDGTMGTLGPVSADNSLVNTSLSDDPGIENTIHAFPDGSVSIYTPYWNDGSHDGAASLLVCKSEITSGPVSADNSVMGDASLGGSDMVSDYDPVYAQLIVGRPGDNRVSLMQCQITPTHWVYLPVVRR
jgi:hypothetical protein